MPWLALLGVVIQVIQGLIGYIKPKLSPLTDEIAAELEAALAKLQSVHGKATSLAELESLRTTKTW